MAIQEDKYFCGIGTFDPFSDPEGKPGKEGVNVIELSFIFWKRFFELFAADGQFFDIDNAGLIAGDLAGDL